MDLRTPVLVGCGQVKQRSDDPRKAREHGRRARAGLIDQPSSSEGA